MFVFENLLRKDYFPNELPPCFNTQSFADNHVEVQNYIRDRKDASEPVIFSGYKNINSRRDFAIPNPLSYAILANTIVKNSTELFKIFDNSKNSLTVPLNTLPNKDQSFVRRSNSLSDSREIVRGLYNSNLVEVRLDIQSFFNSIYTHSIAWAIHTKSKAKLDRSDNLFGNTIDKHVRNLNNQQTNGILTGNAISRIISEVILCKVDEEIRRKHRGIDFTRYVDDYYIYLENNSDVGKVISTIRKELSNYQLSLNENKLTISTSPFVYGNIWVEKIKNLVNFGPKKLLELSIVEFKQSHDISILRYALKAIRQTKFVNEEWKGIEPDINSILISYPNLASYIVLILKNNEDFVDKKLIANSIQRIIKNHVVLQNDEEIIWTLWIAKVLQISISPSDIEIIFNTRNWCAIIIMLDIIFEKKKKRTEKLEELLKNLRTNIETEFFSNPPKNQEGMLKEIWLLAYEANKNNWLDCDDKFEYAYKHDFFKKLIDKNVCFYNGSFTYELSSDESSKSAYLTRSEAALLFKELLFEVRKNSYSTDAEFNVLIDQKIFQSFIEKSEQEY